MSGTAGDGIGQEFEDEPRRRHGEYAGQHKEHIAPAHQIAKHAAGSLAEQLTQNLARQIAGQDRLEAVMRRDVAHIGHRDWDDPSAHGARGKPGERELRQR